MAAELHPAASHHHMPGFMTAPGESDLLMVVTGLFLLAGVVGFGVFYWTLHSLPERLAHRNHKLRFEIVAVLGLISLFTHEHIYWIAGLLLALVDLPDFGGWMGRVAGSVEKIAGVSESQKPPETPESEALDRKPADGPTKTPQEHVTSIRHARS